MSEKSKTNWSFALKVISYVITAIAGFLTGDPSIISNIL